MDIDYVEVRNGRYYIGAVQLNSVTKFIEQFKKPFDRPYWLARKAKERGVGEEVIEAEWNAKGDKSRAAGSAMHQYIDDVLREKVDDPLGLLQKSPHMEAFDDFLAKAEESLELTVVEAPVGDEEWQLGGRPDAIFYSSRTEKHHVFDWKRGDISTYNEWDNLLGAFDQFQGSDLNYYSLQVWLYTMMLERNVKELDMGVPYLVALMDSGRFQAYAAVREIRGSLEQHMNGI